MFVEELVFVFFLCEMEVHAYNCDEEVNAENASDDDEDDEENGDPGVVVHNGS